MWTKFKNRIILDFLNKNFDEQNSVALIECNQVINERSRLQREIGQAELDGNHTRVGYLTERLSSFLDTSTVKMTAIKTKQDFLDELKNKVIE